MGEYLYNFAQTFKGFIYQYCITSIKTIKNINGTFLAYNLYNKLMS